jgi:hypothetical protein
VTELDRLSRSAKDLHETVGRLEDKGVALSIDGKIYDPTDPMGKMFIGVLGLMAEFESDLIRSRTRDAVAAADKMKGRRHKLTPKERAYLLQTYETGQFKIETLCRNTGLKRSALYAKRSRWTSFRCRRLRFAWGGVGKGRSVSAGEIDWRVCIIFKHAIFPSIRPLRSDHVLLRTRSHCAQTRGVRWLKH